MKPTLPDEGIAIEDGHWKAALEMLPSRNAGRPIPMMLSAHVASELGQHTSLSRTRRHCAFTRHRLGLSAAALQSTSCVRR
eukprot:1727177-Rhodomonas_salina.4